MKKVFSFCLSLLITIILITQAPANDDCASTKLFMCLAHNICVSNTAGTTVDATKSNLY